MAIKADFITGKQTFGNWARVFAFVPEDQSGKEMFVVAKIYVDSDEFNLDNAGKLLLDELQGIYFTDTKEYADQVSRLENALWKMKGKMEYILSKEESLVQKGLDIELAVVVYDESFAYAAIVGESRIKIFREGKLIDITEALSDAADSGFFKTGSLELDENDRLFLITSQASKEFADKELTYGASVLAFDKLKAAYPESSEGTAMMMVYKDSAIPLEVEEESEVAADLSEEEIESNPSQLAGNKPSASTAPNFGRETMSAVTEVSRMTMFGEKLKMFSSIAKENLVKAGNFTKGKLIVLKDKVIELNNKRQGREVEQFEEESEGEYETIPTQAPGQRRVAATLPVVPAATSRLDDEEGENLDYSDPAVNDSQTTEVPQEENSELVSEQPVEQAEVNPYEEMESHNLNDESIHEEYGEELQAVDTQSRLNDEEYEEDYEDEGSQEFEDESAPMPAVQQRMMQRNISQEPQGLKDNVLGRVSGVKEKLTGFYQNKLGKNGGSTISTIFQNILSILRELITNGIELFKKEILGVGDNRRDRLTRAKRRRRNRIILIIIVIVLFIVITNSIRSAQEARAQQEQLDTAKSKLTDFQSTYRTLDAKVSTAKAGGDVGKQNLIADLDRLNAEINVQKRDGLLVDDLNTVQKNIETTKDKVLDVVSITTPQVLVDVGKSYPDANLADIEYSNGGVYIADQGRNLIYRVATASLNGVPQSFVSGLAQPYALVRNVDGDIIFYDNDTSSAMGVFEYDKENSLSRYPGLSASSIGKVTESSLFSGNNSLYEVRGSTSQIFKRDQTGGSYVSGGATQSGEFNTNWRVDPDFTNAVDIATPYEIYVLIKGQGIKRYFAREANTLTTNLLSNISQADISAVQNGSSLDVVDSFVAVGDPANKRVFLFRIDDTNEKGLTLIKQYVYRGNENVFTDLDEIVIVPNESALYVLDNLKVIKLPLQ